MEREVETKIRVAIAEDHQLYSDMLMKILKDAGIDCVKHSRSGQEIISFLEQNESPEILLLDLSMPGMDGNETLNRVQNMFPDVAVIIISQYEDEFVIANYLERGVKAYIPKSQHMELLVAAIETVAAGKVYRKNLGAGFRLRSKSIARQPRFTFRELDTIKLIIDGKTNKEIGDELCVSVKTVEVDRTRIYAKAKVKTLAEFMRFVNSAGWYYLNGV